MAENWFYVNNQERLGPFPDSVIRKMAASGIIGASTYVWHEGMPGWVRAGESELAGDLDLNAVQVSPYQSGLHYAGFWVRVCATIVDGFILLPVQMVLMVAGFYLIFHSRDPLAFLASHMFISLLSIVVSAAYEILFVWKKGATPGKMVFELKVVNADNSGNISLGKSIGRYFGKVLSGMIFDIGYIMVAFDDCKRGLHDRICETFVVYKR